MAKPISSSRNLAQS